MKETYIHIDNMRLHAYHGVMPQERTVGNDYVLSIRVGYPWTEAARTDDVGKTINYALLADVIKREMMIPSNLVETVAQRIADAVHDGFPGTTSVRLRLTKIVPPMSHDCDGAGVEIMCEYANP